MNLRSRILLAQLPALLIVVGVVLWGGRTVDSLGALSQHILADNYRSVLAAERMKESVERLDSAALFRVSGRVAEADALVAEHRPKFEAELRAEEGNLTEAGEPEIAARLREDWTRYLTLYDRFLAAPEAERADIYFTSMLPSFTAVKGGAERVLALNEDAMVRRSDDAAAAARVARREYLGWSAFAVLVAVAASAWTTHRLTVPLRALGQAAAEVGEGRLELKLPATQVAELDQVVEAFNTMAHRLRLYRRASDGELARAREAAQAAIESLVDPVLVLTVKGELRGTNEAARRLLGLDARTRRLDGGDAALVDAIQAARTAVAEAGRPMIPTDFAGVVVTQGPEGERAVLPRATPMNDSVTGELVGVTVLLQDVTRLRRLDELKGNLVNTVAHELRTPLTSLGMALHLALDERVSGTLSERLAGLIGAAREDVARMRALVEDLLDLSRIQEGRLVLRTESVAPAPLLEAVRAAVRSAAEEAGVQLDVEVDPAAPLAPGDLARLQVALTNLTVNAVRFSPRGGVVRLRARPVSGALRLEVEDDGPGVPAADRERIFERFVRGEGTPGGGPGLGLYIAREVVRAHQGRIGVEARPRGGARFWVELPAAGPDAPEVPAEGGAD